MIRGSVPFSTTFGAAAAAAASGALIAAGSSVLLSSPSVKKSSTDNNRHCLFQHTLTTRRNSTTSSFLDLATAGAPRLCISRRFASAPSTTNTVRDLDREYSQVAEQIHCSHERLQQLQHALVEAVEQEKIEKRAEWQEILDKVSARPHKNLLSREMDQRLRQRRDTSPGPCSNLLHVLDKTKHTRFLAVWAACALLYFFIWCISLFVSVIRWMLGRRAWGCPSLHNNNADASPKKERSIIESEAFQRRRDEWKKNVSEVKRKREMARFWANAWRFATNVPRYFFLAFVYGCAAVQAWLLLAANSAAIGAAASVAAQWILPAVFIPAVLPGMM